jgi:hypothetical protein
VEGYQRLPVACTRWPADHPRQAPPVQHSAGHGRAQSRQSERGSPRAAGCAERVAAGVLIAFDQQVATLLLACGSEVSHLDDARPNTYEAG